MTLETYFQSLIDRLEASDITNAGKDSEGFFKPTREVLLNQLNLLKDLHDNPLAKKMVQAAWKDVVKDLPVEWLVLSDKLKSELKKILQD